MKPIVSRPQSTFFYRKLALLVLFPVVFTLSSQTAIKFGYDAGGNRIRREPVSPSVVVPKKKMSPRGNHSDMGLGNTVVTVGPNPTTGLIRIVINGFDGKTHPDVYIYNTSGQTILSAKLSDSSIEMDISRYPGGIYIVSVVADDKFETYKIVKH